VIESDQVESRSSIHSDIIRVSSEDRDSALQFSDVEVITIIILPYLSVVGETDRSADRSLDSRQDTGWTSVKTSVRTSVRKTVRTQVRS